MLFNSYEFLFAFLPISLAGFFFLCRAAGRNGGIAWLILCSLFFYGWWNPAYLGLILFSMAVNFAIGRTMGKLPRTEAKGRHWLFGLGVAFNLALLGYYKYASFFTHTVAEVTGWDVALAPIVLPLAISFFTFQQIAYLADVHANTAHEYDLRYYLLFITFYPHLLAGPIVHHKEMMPQFMRGRVLKPKMSNFAVGGTIFAMGLFKKVVIADGVARYVAPTFSAAAHGQALSLFEAWGGALAYTFQLYYDFSGYSDMAIGSALMFGIRLPLNFYSPYKATNIVEFWRRWHITLSRFLRDYLYIPLGGNRRGNARRYVNLLTTMVLGGLWHGAGWTFVLWGTLHGLYLVINHFWNWICRRAGLETVTRTIGYRTAAWLVTFVAVVVGWVFFRAESVGAAGNMLRGMAGLNGIALPNGVVARFGPDAAAQIAAWGVELQLGGGAVFVQSWLWIAALLVLTLVAPNSMQLTRAYRPTVTTFNADTAHAVQPFARAIAGVRWRPTITWQVAVSGIAALSILALGRVSEFLYFQF